MSEAVALIIKIGVAVALAVAVGALAFTLFTDNAPPIGDPGDDYYSRIKTEVLCDAAGGTWTSSSKRCKA